jgi:hypothetical protein
MNFFQKEFLDKINEVVLCWCLGKKRIIIIQKQQKYT